MRRQADQDLGDFIPTKFRAIDRIITVDGADTPTGEDIKDSIRVGMLLFSVDRVLQSLILGGAVAAVAIPSFETLENLQQLFGSQQQTPTSFAPPMSCHAMPCRAMPCGMTHTEQGIASHRIAHIYTAVVLSCSQCDQCRIDPLTVESKSFPNRSSSNGYSVYELIEKLRSAEALP